MNIKSLIYLYIINIYFDSNQNILFLKLMSLINSDSFSIIGSESQTIQIILHKNEKLNINKKYLVSSSSNELREVLFNKINLLLNRNSKENSHLIRLDNPIIINLKNTKANIEYISLSKGGKIMILNPHLYNNLYIKLDSLLAFNNGIELFFDIKKNRIFDTFFFYKRLVSVDNLRRNMYINNTQSDIQFYLIKPKLKTNLDSDNLQELSPFIFNKNNTISDMLFISGKSSLFEKRLGEGESMILSAQSLIAFEGSVSFELIEKREGYVNIKNHIFIKGPGLIIFEPGEKIIYENNKKKKIVIIFAILSLLIHLLIYISLILD